MTKVNVVVENKEETKKNNWIFKLGISILLCAGVLYSIVEYTLGIFIFNISIVLLVLINYQYIIDGLKRFGLIKEEKAKK